MKTLTLCVALACLIVGLIIILSDSPQEGKANVSAVLTIWLATNRVELPAGLYTVHTGLNQLATADIVGERCPCVEDHRVSSSFGKSNLPPGYVLITGWGKWHYGDDRRQISTFSFETEQQAIDSAWSHYDTADIRRSMGKSITTQWDTERER